MICKTCGQELQEGAKACGNCGMTLAEMGIFEKKEIPGNISDFEKRAQRFGGVTVKEKKASAFSNVDPKIVSIVLPLIFILIFIVGYVIVSSKKITADMVDYSVVLPATLKKVDDRSFEVMDSFSCESYANNTMEFTCVKYDASELLPDLQLMPTDDDIEAMNRYYSAQNELLTLDDSFTDELDETFAEDLKKYKCIKHEGNQLEFTYSDGAMADNYVWVRVIVKDETIYQFSLLCSEDYKDKYRSKFDEIYRSIQFK
ncbi:hypothetical protein [Ruminococcus sp.]|uniref:hypothetical protein n=1 Tax=Ruminococcus sp. TaxID=41978 RepID=UPI0025E83A59|nr:hypothetical protein [Ruminococcus sp.]MBQ8965814.1 zinc ribbon domain-containing protein [Ruminococcus sp.]